MILDSTFGRDKSLPSEPVPEPEAEDKPPAYSQAAQTTSVPSSSGTLSLSRNTQTVVPFSTPINGLHMYSKSDPIRGSWSLDPLAALVPESSLVQTFLDGQRKRKCRRGRSSKTMPLTAKFATRYSNIQASLYVLGNSMVRSIATIHAESRKGNIVLELVDIALTRTVHIDAHSRKGLSDLPILHWGSVTLLVPRSYCGLVQLYSRHGRVEILPALAASGRVINTKNKETTILLGEGPMPQLGPDSITDTARIRSRHGHVRLGYSGEDYFTEPPKFMDQAIQFVQKRLVPSLQKTIAQKLT